MGPPSLVSNFQPIQGPTSCVEQVRSVKLLGVHLDSNFSWKSHVKAILFKATQQLNFLKLLNHVGVPQVQQLRFYITLIRPILEYAAPVWHHLLTKSQTDLNLATVAKNGSTENGHCFWRPQSLYSHRFRRLKRRLQLLKTATQHVGLESPSVVCVDDT